MLPKSLFLLIQITTTSTSTNSNMFFDNDTILHFTTIDSPYTGELSNSLNILPGKFIEWLSAAEMHWHFVQAIEAGDYGFWLPSAICTLAAIENSLRVSVCLIEGVNLKETNDLKSVFSNNLINKAKGLDLPVHLLAFPNEEDFEQKLPSRTNNVDIVQLRHDLCHGNILKYVNKELGEDNAFFTPECLRDLMKNTLGPIAVQWAQELGAFRKAFFDKDQDQQKDI